MEAAGDRTFGLRRNVGGFKSPLINLRKASPQTRGAGGSGGDCWSPRCSGQHTGSKRPGPTYASCGRGPRGPESACDQTDRGSVVVHGALAEVICHAAVMTILERREARERPASALCDRDPERTRDRRSAFERVRSLARSSCDRLHEHAPARTPAFRQDRARTMRQFRLFATAKAACIGYVLPWGECRRACYPVRPAKARDPRAAIGCAHVAVWRGMPTPAVRRRRRRQIVRRRRSLPPLSRWWSFGRRRRARSQSRPGSLAPAADMERSVPAGTGGSPATPTGLLRARVCDAPSASAAEVVGTG